jgi:toxin-antitoxin system PIN domain toxin
VRWFENLQGEEVAFCRITQMGFLRLLTNARVMGVDVITQGQAWDVYQTMMQDSRIVFFSEPAGVEAVWQQYTRRSHPAPNLWTDAYLFAFAKIHGLQIVSFDKGFSRFSEHRSLILE